MRVLLLAMCVLAAAGCAAKKTAPNPEATATDTVSYPDEIIGKQVRYRLETQCPGDAGNIKIIVSDGIVTLQGVASSQAVAWRAQAAATAVPGVKSVRNELLVRR